MELSQKDKRALKLCGIFLAVNVVYFGMIDPYVVRYDAAVKAIDDHEKSLQSLTRKKKLLRPRQRKLKTTRDEVDAMLELFGGSIDENKQLSACIGDFQKAASQAGVYLHSIRPLPSGDESHPAFDDYRFELDFSGSYPQIQRMLHKLEAGHSLLVTKQFILKQDKDNVRCRMMLERSFFKGLQEPSSAAVEVTSESEPEDSEG